MKHCFIAPTKYLHMIPASSTMHLLLAHLMKNEEYSEYYRIRQSKGDFIVVDNGAFEFGKPLDPEEYAKLVENSGITPDVVVAPDYPKCDWRKTVDGLTNFITTYGSYFDTTKTKIMFVPQSYMGDYEGWIEAYRLGCSMPGVEMIGMSILGIPNAFQTLTGTTDISFNRTFATEYLKKRLVLDHSKKHHYLGCGDPRELLMMKTQGIAYSNDSSTAFWHGILGDRFDDSSRGLRHGKTQLEVDFELAFTNTAVEDINHNIAWIQRLLK